MTSAKRNSQGRRHTDDMKNCIRLLRVERRWSQAKLGEQLGVSRQSIAAIERGKHGPSLIFAFQLSRLFGRRIEDIFKHEP